MTRRYRTRDALAIVGGGDLARSDAAANLSWDRRPAEGSFRLSCDKQQVHRSARKTTGRSTHFCGGLLGSQQSSTRRSCLAATCLCDGRFALACLVPMGDR
jgi:hypothetical protein